MQHKKYVLSLLLSIFLVQITIAGKIDKGFEALKLYNYFKAKEIFQKSLKKTTSPAAYGLAVIYYRNDNPFHSLDSAFKYICIAEKSFPLLKEKSKEKYKNLDFDLLRIAELQRNVSTEFYHIAKKENTLASYAEFVQKHPWSLELNKAIFSRDSIAYQQAKMIGTSSAVQDFILTYPESSSIKQAKADFYLLQYQEMTKSNTIAAYKEFQVKCPENPYFSNADDKIYELATDKNQIQSLKLFIDAYPKNRNIGDAWMKIYRLFMVDDQIERFEQFSNAFPDFPYTEELEKDLELSKRNLLPFNENNLMGLMDFEGNILVQAQYDNIGTFKEGLAFASKDGKYGFINKGNQLIIPFVYDNVNEFIEGRAVVEKNELYGLIDRAGNEILPCIYKELGNVSEELLFFLKDSLYGYFDKQGELVIKEKFEEAFDFQNGMAKVEIQGNKAYVNRYGNFTVPPFYEDISFYSDSLLIFGQNDFFGLIDLKGKQILAAEYDYIGPLKNNRSLIVKDNKIGYINEKGFKIVDLMYEIYPNYKARGQFQNGKALVFQKEKFGFIGVDGKALISSKFQDLGAWSKLIAYKKNDKWGFINNSGVEVMKAQYDFAQSFVNGIAIVENFLSSGVINEKGNIIVPISFQSIAILKDALFLVSSGSKFGLLDWQGKVLVPVDYEQIRVLNEELIILLKDSEIQYFYIPTKSIIARKKTINE